MDDHVDLVRTESEEPFSLNDFEAFVHESGRVDSDFCTHLPSRMFESIGSFDMAKLFERIVAEWSARGSEYDFFDLVVVLAYKTLEDCSMLRIDREDGCVVFLHEASDEVASNDKSFFVGKGYAFASFDSSDCWGKTRVAYHCSNDCGYGIHCCDLGYGIATCEYFDRKIGESFFESGVMGFVAYDYYFGIEFSRLGYKFVYTVVGSDGINIEEVGIFANYVEGLSAYGAC